MKKLFESTIRSAPWLLALFVVGFINQGYGYKQGVDEKIEASKNDLIKAPSHINLEDRNYLQKVYSDEEHDIAYYVWLGERDIVEVGDILYTCEPEITATVTSVDVYGIYFSVSQPISQGMSGTILTNKSGTAVGMISSYLDSGLCYAIWI